MEILFWDITTTPAEEEEMIKRIAEDIHRRRLDEVAIILIRGLEPLNYIGTQLGRVFVLPFLPAFGENVGITGNKFIQIFEKSDNVKKLLDLIEEMASEENEPIDDESKDPENKVAIEKKGWKRYFPF